MSEQFIGVLNGGFYLGKINLSETDLDLEGILSKLYVGPFSWIDRVGRSNGVTCSAVTCGDMKSLRMWNSNTAFEEGFKW